MKLAIFDFDNVLSLNETSPAFRSTYERRLLPWLASLKDRGIALCIASSNKNVKRECQKMNINDIPLICVVKRQC